MPKRFRNDAFVIVQKDDHMKILVKTIDCNIWRSHNHIKLRVDAERSLKENSIFEFEIH